MAGTKIEHSTQPYDGFVYFLTDTRDCYRVWMDYGNPIIECVAMNVPPGNWPPAVQHSKKIGTHYAID